ncbi:MAG: DUF2851 family protein [Prevotellaceae bacterium]|jgi:hypothetical protein|nr:DUF2851 family protein [Prevotellaceae bacterium]
MNIPEALLHYVWQHKLFYINNLTTTDGVPVEVVDTGKSNTDAGPDFFNAKIRIGSTLWAGNVEIHTRSSEWNKHKHLNNKAYDNVILHVVCQADVDIFRSDGTEIPQMALSFPAPILQNYRELLSAKKQIPCENRIKEVPEIIINLWKTALLTERLQQKTAAIFDLLFQNNNNWEDTFYVVLARNFGFGTNSEPFEQLAKSLPHKILATHKNNILQIEALLFGQANLLPTDSADPRVLALKKEYDFLAKKYGLQAIEGSQWKLLRLRPDNFPYVRIAQFAALVVHSSKLFSKIVETTDLAALRAMFDCKPCEFWETHYRFEHQSKRKTKNMSRQTVDILLINTVAPMLFAYAEKKKNAAIKETALSILEQLPPEKNAIVTYWNALGINATSAFETQALIQLKKNYCDLKKCLHCRIGHKIVAKQQ